MPVVGLVGPISFIVFLELSSLGCSFFVLEIIDFNGEVSRWFFSCFWLGCWDF